MRQQIVVIIGSDHGLAPLDPFEQIISEIWIEIFWISLQKMHLKMSPVKWRTQDVNPLKNGDAY